MHDRAEGGLLTIDLNALRFNYRLLVNNSAPSVTAAVVKADAYGLGATRVSRALFEEGCRTFFVATVSEACELRLKIPAEARVFVLNGLTPGSEAQCAALDIQPVLNCLDHVLAWSKCARLQGRRLKAALQLDTGMSRFGLSAQDVGLLVAEPERLAGVELVLLMSHLACADEPGHAANAAQRAVFHELAMRFPGVPRSLANSAGVFLGRNYQFDMVRPGIALYGGNPGSGSHNPMRPVVRLDARVAQVRSVPAGSGVGYGLTFTADQAMRLATIAVGYADGWRRSLSGSGAVFIDDVRLPIVGRISMDSLVIDISGLGDRDLRPGGFAQLIGPNQSIDAVAADAGTIAYEILTSLGRRYSRVYLDGQEKTLKRLRQT
jgi:alanine racemase